MSQEDAARFESLLALRALVDNVLEPALIERQSLAEMMSALLPAVRDAVGARGAWVESYGEDLKLQVFASPQGLVIPRREDVLARTAESSRERVVVDAPEAGSVVVAQPLDVAGEWFGRTGFVFDAGGIAPDRGHALALLAMMSEELDNFLYAIRAAREKQAVMMELGVALRHRVLAEGLRAAIEVLRRAVPVERMLIVYLAEEQADSTLHVQLYEGGALRLDTLTLGAAVTDEIRAEGCEYLRGRSRRLLERFDFVDAQEEVLINGVTRGVVVGKIVASAKGGAFNTTDRDLLDGFAAYICQRVVDLNKEWRRLAASFRDADVARLLQSDDYERRHLEPREAEVAMLYVDISGFTRLSETVLKTPTAVARFVEAWSRDAVDLVWKHGGVFDKMVGDCVIALFGPPFYESAPGDRLAAAIRCAVDVRAMTSGMPEREGFEVLRSTGVGVSTGVNLAPLFVGTFGPNGNFTGFSSGMNNTARLQGCAHRDEILVMDDAVHRLSPDHGFAFGDARSTAVKNVAAPLRYRPLLG